ncbi:MAG: formiminoglutamase, partial [Caulobacteraceae bacterium]|nr:formiminoglutamase [Caulobacteraceae bacterium]
MPHMNAWEPIAAEDAPAAATFDLLRAVPQGDPPPTPLVFASPLSGRGYPADMGASAALDALSIRRSEDAFVDDLIAGAPALGVATLNARLARAYIDVNREAFELDPGMFADELPDFARARTARVAAGLGAIARVVS